jgi:DNA-directed RNA polymerase specialized sigma24 family protein
VSNAEAAATLGVGVKALESLLVRARQGLGRSLTAQGMLQEGSAA